MFRLCLTTAVIAALTACGGKENANSSDSLSLGSVSSVTPTPTALLPASPSGTNSGQSTAFYKNLKATEMEAKILVAATEESLETHLKNGIRLNVHIFNDDYFEPSPREPVPVASSGPEPLEPRPEPAGTPTAAAIAEPQSGSADDFALSENATNFSTTNIQVAGVDEADVVKYDGEHLFIASSEQEFFVPEGLEATNGYQILVTTVRIMETDPTNAGITQIGSISIPPRTNWGAVTDLYLHQEEQATKSLIVLSSTGGASFILDDVIEPMPLPMPAVISDIASSTPNDDITFPSSAIPEPTTTDSPDSFEDSSGIADSLVYAPPSEPNKIFITSYNVENPNQPSEAFTIEIEGEIHSSRKIDNMLYLVTRFTPTLPEIGYYFGSEEAAAENETKIDALTLDDLLPKYSQNGGQQTSLLQAHDCLIPADLESDYGHRQIISIVAIDLENQAIDSARCLNTYIGGIYASQNNIYLGGSSYQFWGGANSMTVIHKFAFEQGLHYKSTGFVQGTLGWDNPSYRMSENGDYLRVVTTWFDDNFFSPTHQLSILTDNEETDEMEFVAGLPSEDRPQKIGKPNEDIYAVRFVGDKAYIVTFERTDPLYAINLSNPEDPFIAGELEVPGFSNYLHPIDDDYLIGVGQDADESGFATGLKISLFDIRDMNNPLLVNSETIGSRGTRSSAEHDPRAFTFLRSSDDQMRIAIPASIYEDWNWQENALTLFEINGLASDAADLTSVGKLTVESSDGQYYWPYSQDPERSILHDEALYFAYGSDVWAAFWSSPESATGPH